MDARTLDKPDPVATAPIGTTATSQRETDRRSVPLSRQIIQCVVVALLSFASYFCISHFLFQSVQVVGASMSPTLHHSGFYILNRCIYWVRDPRPGDVVVLRDPVDQSYSVKRIIAGNGDTVRLFAGRVYVNGRELYEPYLPSTVATYPHAHNHDTFRCGPGEYFVMGDNRMDSTDSRVYGPVHRSRILGTVLR
ncbi:MAG: signal peptidase I [Verrucomicrobiae bacterium]|nr:signal peptidase I [Verrucomicrobiae bacterium]MDW8308866.1 signal peptidase I [Verrucomicrobiales bacterium]